MNVRKAAIVALIAGLCLAALTAIVALLTGDFGDTHARIIGTSLGFSVFSALGAAGTALWQRAGGQRWAGAGTSAAALLAYVLLLAGIWSDDAGDGLWRAFGVSALLALWGSHASLVLRASRRDDTPIVTTLVWVSIVAAAIDMVIADVAILDVYDDVDDGVVRFAAVVLVVMILATALPPLIRRLAGPQRPPAAADAFGRAEPARPQLTVATLADEVEAAAARLDAAQTLADVRREAAGLRALAERVRR